MAGLQNGEPGIVAMFEERPEEYADRAAGLGFDLNTPQQEGQLKLLYIRPLDLSVDETVREIIQKTRRRGPIMPEALLTVDEAAERLKMKPATLRSQLRAGRIASVRTGKLWRIPESALEPTPARRDVAPIYPKANTPSAPDAPKGSELDALFAPSTPQEIARQLDALDKLTAAAPRADAAPELDLSGDRGEVYGYAEREERQL